MMVSLMRAELELIIDELKRLKEEGNDSVYIADDTINALKAALLKESKESAEPNKTSRVNPPSPEVASANSFKPPELKTTGKKPKEDSTVVPIPPPSSIKLPPGDKQRQWNWLRERVLNCPVCKEHVRPGKKVVFGVGNLDASIFFCGEAPGAEEEIEGEPFVGPAGQLLTRIIETMGLPRGDVYIGNIMNWRPKMPTAIGNRPPTEEEMSFCLPYLRAQLEIVQPQVIVALGATAVSGLLGPDSKRRIGAVRGKWFEFEDIPLLVTYHPSYVLRNGSNYAKRLIWEDMMQVMEKVGLPLSEKQRRFFKEATSK